jgi:hypothetical protein
MPSHLYAHYEEGPESFTLKLVLGRDAMSVRDALARFAQAYAGTGYGLKAAALRLSSEVGQCLSPDAVLPCGLPSGSDVFVTSAEPAAELEGELAPIAKAAAAAAVMAAAAGPSVPYRVGAQALAGASSSSSSSAAAGTTSVVKASQAKMGENSYYYSVGKNTGAPPAAPAKPKAVAHTSTPTVAAATAATATITSYSMVDDDKVVEVYVPFPGAKALPAGNVRCDFRDRSFDLTVLDAEGKRHRLHIPILLEEIKQEECKVKKKVSKLVLVLVKRSDDKGPWYELRKTKGVGDHEFSKIVPDGGESVIFEI